jgi:hypothetical protein
LIVENIENVKQREGAMMAIAKRCVATIVCLLVFTGFCLAQEGIISAEGHGLGATADEALLAAKRDAVEKGIGTILLSQTEIQNFQAKKDQIITKTVGAVKSFEKISEGKTTDGLFEVRIKAALSQTAMRQDLAAFHILLESMDKPRTMVVVAENNVGSDEPTNETAEATILQFLKDPYQFDLVDPKTAAAIRSSRQKMAALAGDNTAAAAIGAQSGAEVLITGTAISREAKNLSQNLGGMVSVQADVTLKALNCATGSIMGTSQAHAAKVHLSPNTAGNQAIAQASQKAIEKLLDAIIKEWQNVQNNGVTLNITVSNVATFRLKNDIVLSLQGVSGVAAVRERNWDGQSKALTVDVQYKGNANGFCTRIDGYKLKSGSGSVSVSSVNGNAILLVIQAM